jgi:tripartite ATP-independent transporter DctM subunit
LADAACETAALPAEAPSAAAAFLGRIDTAIGWITEISASILVLVEIVILFAGVVARYVLDRPFTWSDELATILFLWLAMLGSVIALRRGEHMRLTAVVQFLPRTLRPWIDAFAAMIVIVFVGEIILPAGQYAQAQWVITTPALGIHDTWHVLSIPICVALMFVVALTRLFTRASIVQALCAVVAVAVTAGCFWLAAPALQDMDNANLLVFFVGLLGVCVALGVPIGFAFGVATLSYLALVTGMPLTIVMSRMEEGMSDLLLLAVPLFIFLGLLIEMTGLARALVDFMASVLGHVRGGLGYVLLGAMYLISGISGSKAADMAAVVPILFPEMKRRGNEPSELIALLAASGAMSETIPPSIVLITIGSVTGTSIAALFTGGLMPALVAAAAIGVLTWFRSRRDKPLDTVRPSLRTIGRSFIVALPALALPVLIRSAVVDGVATATEVSTVGIAYAVLAGLLIYRRFDWRRIYPMLVETASLSGAILFIVGMATAMAWALTQSGFSQQLADAMAAVPGGKAGFLAVSILCFAILGSILEGIPAIVLFGPLLFPIAKSMGIHEVQYAMVAILAMGIGLFAPPFGVGYYFACAIGGVSPDRAMGRVYSYLLVLLLAVILVASVPWISVGFL